MTTAARHLDPRPPSPEPRPPFPRPEVPARPQDPPRFVFGAVTIEPLDDDLLPALAEDTFAMSCWMAAAVSIGCTTFRDTRGKESEIAAEQRRLFAHLTR